MHRSIFLQRYSRHGCRTSSHEYETALAPSFEENKTESSEDELERLHRELETAAEFVFQQKLAIYRLNSGAPLPEGADQSLQVVGSGAEYKAAFNHLTALEDNLSENANRCIRTSNVTALHLLNEGQYSCALHILLQVETIVQKDAGRWYAFSSPDMECVAQDTNGYVPSIKDPRVGGERYEEEIFVPFFTRRHETMRELALAVIENNIGLYHFKIAEYKFAAQRISRALQLEETHDVKTIGVTYFNLAQTQYELGSIEEAFSAIALAEDAIEKRIHESQSQRNYFFRISEHRGDVSPTTMTDLEKRSFAVYISWREAVCMLSRVLEVHGGWLQSTGAYRAAMHCYQKSDRWLLSVKELSAEETSQRQELRLRIHECRRCQRHSCCASKFAVASTGVSSDNSSAPPRSVIVTTALPRRIVLTTRASPAVAGTKKSDREVLRTAELQRKPRYKDANEMSSVVGPGNCPGESPLLVYTSPFAAPRPDQRRPARRCPPWDPTTTVVRGDTTRGRTPTPNFASRGNSEARAPSRRALGTGARFLRRRAEERKSSECSVSLTDTERKSLGPTQSREPTSAKRHALLIEAQVPARGASCSTENGETVSSLSSGKVCILSLAQCIQTLQAFARAKVSQVEAVCRRHFSELGLVSATSYGSYTFFSPSVSLSSVEESLDGAQIPSGLQDSNCPLQNGKASVERTLFCSTAPLRLRGVLLAFLMAYRSARLVYRRRIDQQYIKVMRETQLQSVGETESPYEGFATTVLGMAQEKASAPAEEYVLNDVSLSFATRVDDAPNGNGHACHGREEETPSPTFHDDSGDGVGVSKERFYRRYSSLLRVLPRGGERSASHASNTREGKRNSPNGKLGQVISNSNSDDASSRFHIGPPVAPSTSGDVSGRSDEVECPLSSAKRRSFRVLHSTAHGTTRAASSVPRSAHSLFGQRDGSVGAVECSAGDMLSERGVHYVQGKLPRRQSITRGAAPSCLSQESCRRVTGAAAGFIRQRVAREEAASIIQRAWRSWRARRQLEAVRGLFL